MLPSSYIRIRKRGNILSEKIYFWSLYLAIGLTIGSFLNVCIYRIPKKKSVVYGRSYCPSCGSLIPWYCNIPVFSYLFLLGRSKCCHLRISPIYPAIELLNGILYSTAYLVLGLGFWSIIACVILSVLIVVISINFKTDYIRLSK